MGEYQIPGFIKVLICIAIVIFLVLLYTGTPLFGYIAARVQADEIGLVIIRGKLIEMVGPGTYDKPFVPFADLVTVKISALNFSATDEEVLTKDLQRIGVEVSGTVSRPGMGAMTETLWSQYRPYYTDDSSLLERMTIISRQAMKVCVGEKTFQEAAVGAARNDLTDCIDSQLSEMGGEFGLDIRNVVVPNVTLGETVQTQLDLITSSRNATLLAEQEKLRFEAESERNLAEQQGVIKVEQGKVQEQFRQDAITADLERQTLEKERAVIDQQKSNELASAEADLKIATVNTSVAEQDALAETARERAIAQLFQDNPQYAAYLAQELVSKALAGIEKIIVPAGTNPLLIFGNEQIQPLVEVTP
jgi:hypothetical protein